MKISNKEFAKELHKPIIRKSNKRKVYSPFIENIWGPGLADMQLMSKFNNGFSFLLCVIDIYSKYAWQYSKYAFKWRKELRRLLMLFKKF